MTNSMTIEAVQKLLQLDESYYIKSMNINTSITSKDVNITMVLVPK